MSLTWQPIKVYEDILYYKSDGIEIGRAHV